VIGRLFLLAHGRSGDKGDAANVGVIARREEWYEFIKNEITAKRVAQHLKSLADGPVDRYELDNLGALNFVVHRALGGGGSVSLRLDAQGKTYAQAVLRMPVEISGKLEKEVLAHWGKNLPADCVVSKSKPTSRTAGPTKPRPATKKSAAKRAQKKTTPRKITKAKKAPRSPKK
jgi:hypothetical protein